ncbi:MAG: hypothetical protein LRZ84_14350 [Desertifilum sp.]|nr:hypothetical protein [Desertifilum sp.]
MTTYTAPVTELSPPSATDVDSWIELGADYDSAYGLALNYSTAKDFTVPELYDIAPELMKNLTVEEATVLNNSEDND